MTIVGEGGGYQAVVVEVVMVVWVFSAYMHDGGVTEVLRRCGCWWCARQGGNCT